MRLLKPSTVSLLIGLGLTGTAARAEVKYTFAHGSSLAALPLAMSSTDLINNLPASSILLNPDLAANWPFNTNGYKPIANMGNPCLTTAVLTLDSNLNAGISGFHGASGPAATAKLKLVDGLPGAKVDSVLADFAYPAAVFQFDLPQASDIGEIRVFAANTDHDGRVFQDYDVFVSTDANPDTKERVFTPLISEVITSIRVCAGPTGGDGFAPNGNDGTIEATVTRVFDDANTTLATGITSVRFVFWPVSNTARGYEDRWLGINPIPPDPNSCNSQPEDVDPEDFDGQKRAFESSVIKEIDILAAPRTVAIENCNDTNDNDGDGLIDGDDPDCMRGTCPPENCTDGIDNDGNGLTDCDDPDCRLSVECAPEICEYGEDANGDGLADCDDPQCAPTPACQCDNPVYDVTGGGPAGDEPDGAVDMEDFAAFQRCLTIGGGLFADLPQVCKCMDKSGPSGTPDQVIDANDFTVFANCATGPAPAAPVDPDCDGPP
ncbi:MAG: hypothetical protein HY718_03000 [Planctomycetes bacterium]|nr:hypothetical protein [Planctomycetota bacterium]